MDGPAESAPRRAPRVDGTSASGSRCCCVSGCARRCSETCASCSRARGGRDHSAHPSACYGAARKDRGDRRRRGGSARHRIALAVRRPCGAWARRPCGAWARRSRSRPATTTGRVPRTRAGRAGHRRAARVGHGHFRCAGCRRSRARNATRRNAPNRIVPPGLLRRAEAYAADLPLIVLSFGGVTISARRSRGALAGESRPRSVRIRPCL